MCNNCVRYLIVSVLALAGLFSIQAVLPTAVALSTMPADEFHTCNAAAANVIWGTDHDDRLYGTPEDDVIFALGGSDYIRALGGNDCIVAGAGQDAVWGQDGDDIIFGQAGEDKISGGHGFDRLVGGTGADRLLGDFGPDFMDGGEGDDVLDGRSEENICQNGEHNRRCLVHLPLANTGQFAATVDLFSPTTYDTPTPLAGQPIIASGQSQHLPAGSGVWVLVRPYSLDKFYPQLDGSCAAAQPITAENWQVSVYLGLPGDQPEWFDIVVIVTDAAGSALIQNHIQSSCGNDPGITRSMLEMQQVTQMDFATVRTR